jgi:hypothetical protein
VSKTVIIIFSISAFLILTFPLIPSIASAQSIESISLIELERTVQKPFIYSIEQSFSNPFLIDNGRAILYQPDPDHIQIYDYYMNQIRMTYTVNGKVTSVDQSGSFIAIGTSKGEVLILDEASNYSARKFEGWTSSVTQITMLSNRYVFALYSDGSMIQYDLNNNSWISYRPFSLQSTTENIQQFQIIKMWKDGGNLLLLCSPVFPPIGKIYLQLNPTTNETQVSGLQVVLNFTDTGFVLSGTTDAYGYVEFNIPPGENNSSVVSVYISSQKTGFYYYLGPISVGDLMNKLNYIPYPPSNAPLVSIPYIANNYILYLATPNPSGLNIINTYAFTADSVYGLKVEDGSLGFKYILLSYKGGYLYIDRLSSTLSLTGRDTFSRWNVVSYDSDSSGKFIALGTIDGTLFVLNYSQKGFSTFQSYKLTSTPWLVRVISASPLSIISFDGNYLHALVYSQNNYTLWPILRTENSNGYYVQGVTGSVFGTGETLLFFTPDETLILDGIQEIFNYMNLDLRTRTLSTVYINVIGEDGSIPGDFNATLKGRITYTTTGSGKTPLIFRNVLPDNYTLIINPVQQIYDPIAKSLLVTGSSNFNITLPLHRFNLSVELTDNTTNSFPKGTFSYSITSSGGFSILGNWAFSEGPLILNLTYGKYLLNIVPQYSSIYPSISLSFSIPENLSISINITRHTYLYGVQVLDKLTNSPATGIFRVEITDTKGEKHAGTTDYQGIAYIPIDDVGNMSISIVPLDEKTSKIYNPVTVYSDVSFQMVKQIYLDRRNYTLSLNVIDLDTNIPASGATVKIASYSVVLGPNGTLVFVLPANNYVITVQGGIYTTIQKTISLYDNTTTSIGVRRIMGTLTVRVIQSGGTPISNAYVHIDGIDNVNTYTFITDFTGEVTANLPLGLYRITVSAPDYVTYVGVWNISSTTPQMIEARMNYTVVGYFKAYGIYILIIVVAAILILYMRRYVRKKLDLLAQKELEEEVF